MSFTVYTFFAEMEFHPGMNSSLPKRQEWSFIQGWKKEKKTCRHFIPGYNFTMTMFLFNFWRMCLICFLFNMSEHIESQKKDTIGPFYKKVKPVKSLSFIFFVKFTKYWNFSLFLSLLYWKVSWSYWMPEIRHLFYIWLQCLVYPYHLSMLFLLNKSHCIVSTLVIQFLFYLIS